MYSALLVVSMINEMMMNVVSDLTKKIRIDQFD